MYVFLYYYMYLFIICVYGLFKLVQKIINKYLNIDTYYFIDCKFTADIKLCVHLYMST